MQQTDYSMTKSPVFSMKSKLKTILLVLWLLIFSLIYFHTTDSFDQDLGRHLKIGELIWQEKEVPKTNIFSYTNRDEPVFNSHWGSQVIFYAIHQAFGVNGLILLNTIVNTASFGLLFTVVVQRAGLLIPSILFTPFLFLLLDRNLIRPEMFGNLFYAPILAAIFVKKLRVIKFFFALIALLWTNLHITALFGVFAMFVLLLQDIRESKEKRKTIVINLILAMLILIALFINPYGTEGLRSAFTVLNKYGYAIVENQSWLFLRDFGFPLVSHIFFGFLIVVGSFFMLLVRKRKPRLGELILLLATSVLVLRFVRNEIFFAYTAFLTTSLNLSSFRPRRNYSFVVILLMLMSVFLITRYHNEQGLSLGFGVKESYEKGVDFFLSRKLKGPIFNNFDIGGYLIYRLYPKEKVFVDNRPEAYPVDFFQKVYIPMQTDRNIFRKLAKEYNFQTILWGRRDITPWSHDFLMFIGQNSDWQVAYVDEAFVIFTRTP